MDSVCWQRQIVGLEKPVRYSYFKPLHHVFHMAHQKKDLFYEVRPDQFTSLNFDKSYQNIDSPWAFFPPVIKTQDQTMIWTLNNPSHPRTKSRGQEFLKADNNHDCYSLYYYILHILNYM